MSATAQPIGPPLLLDALARRLRTVAGALLSDTATPAALDTDPGTLLSDVVTAVVARGARDDEVWLLLCALGAAFPTHDELVAARRALSLEEPDEACLWLLDAARPVLVDRGDPGATLTLVVGGTVVDVARTVATDRHTGIQRVVRQTVQRWHRDHDVTLVTWSERWGATRLLSAAESDRVLAWDDRVTSEPVEPPASTDFAVPWRSVLVLPEVPPIDAAEPLAALAEHSGNSVVAVGYDAIPVVSADLRPWAEPSVFVRYLSVVKHVRRVAGISVAATEEFRGFASALTAQGLAGPDVFEVPLTYDAIRPDVSARPTALPMVLCVGSQEVHKNHLAVLHAAERLWREGYRFELVFVGRPGWEMADFDATTAELVAAGRDLRVERAMTDDALAQAYADARFTVFVSLHEGYGLPVAESLGAGTPVLTSDLGSMREIGAEGGCLLVDPHDDEAVLTGMRTLLDDDELVGRLRQEAASRPARGWDDYADELWSRLVEGNLHP